MDLAKTRDKKNQSGNEERFIVFKVSDAEFGADIKQIKEVIQPAPISKVPRTPDFVEGVMDLRGTVIPIINLRKRFNYPQKDKDENTRVLIVELPEGIIGFIADMVLEIIRINRADFREPPRMISGIDAEYIKTIAKSGERLVIILELSKILTESEKKLLRSNS